MLIDRVENGTCTVVKLSGDVDARSIIELSRSLKDIAIASAAPKIVISMEQLRIINSQCIGIIVNSLRDVKSRGGNIVFSLVPRNIQEIFRILGLDSVFSFFDSDETALKQLNKS